MPLRDYQTQIDLATLYEVRATGRGSEQLSPTIEIIGGTADIYVSQTEPASAPAGMTKIENGAGIVGTFGFQYVPSFLWVAQATGTTTSIVVSGIDAIEVV
jgi:hypothetical protein